MARRRLFLDHNLNRKRKKFQGSDGKKETKSVLLYSKRKVIISCFFFLSLSLSLSLNFPGLTNLIEVYHYCIYIQVNPELQWSIHYQATKLLLILVSQLCYFRREKKKNISNIQDWFTQDMLVIYSSYK